ncbi:phosphoenolpyruvate--protein phosphotransferase [Anaerobacillus sp. MEB173]|uniref:phosphoenolpyruvate--protein phosphotransferase n=1 Tax=Anaerobacillus sp. MEB173 TaxID=3383345 RepID=UPI003F9078D5
MTVTIKGIAASSGIAIAKAFRLVHPNLTVEKQTIADIDSEIQRLNVAIDKSQQELELIKDHANKELGEDKAAIFAAHLLVLSDPELIGPIKEKITNEKLNAEAALDETAQMFITMFEQMDNEYMQERAADIRDVTKRVLAHLLGVIIPNPSMVMEEVIIVSEDLTPSDTAQLNRQYVKGFTTDIGGRTSHSAIMARSMEIPAVVGTKTVTEEIQNGDLIIVDGLDGQIIINPTEQQLTAYQQKQSEYADKRAEWAKLKNEATSSSDGIHVELAANIGTPDDVQGVLENGGEGVGLYRTEFLYMGRDKLPTEEEQFAAYKKVLERMEGKPVVVRTLDIGGDKELPYLQLPKEMNPFLGFRAIRLCLEEQEMFRTQLRALLRASQFGNLKIMFPMIATLEEFRQAKSILLEEKEKLQSEAIPFADQIEIGMMVEIPSSALIADQFAKEVDFFSIGTNDLIQYTMAADRMNEQVSYLYQPYHPSILRLVNMVIEAAHKEGKWAGMCGEMAGDTTAIPILLGFGLDEFSMSASSILPARSLIKDLSKQEMSKHKENLLMLSTAEEVASYVKDKMLK